MRTLDDGDDRHELLTLLFLLLAIDVRAHTVGQSYLYLQVYENRVAGRFEISLADFWGS